MPRWMRRTFVPVPFAIVASALVLAGEANAQTAPTSAKDGGPWTGTRK